MNHLPLRAQSALARERHKLCRASFVCGSESRPLPSPSRRASTHRSAVTPSTSHNVSPPPARFTDSQYLGEKRLRLQLTDANSDPSSLRSAQPVPGAVAEPRRETRERQATEELHSEHELR
ncbi:hypothetical protein DNTS_035748 [Danionella cerebrum]|uniref:Uncharacterized protein n=1 Tax=Danionella cerebrum TaxID=2873325 RepID=A0A553Q3C7_9TELE|nr:hypothetical protein DNTS_035748 [Danionella translucida]